MRLHLVNLRWSRLAPLALGVVALLLAVNADAQSEPVARTTINSALIVWHPVVSYERLTLRVSTPEGEVVSHDFVGNQPVTLSAPSIDGTYTYELRVTPVIDAGVKKALADARKRGDDEAVERDFRKRKLIPNEALAQSGAFSVVRGALVVPSSVEE
jgi:hypothetical protein